MDAVTRRQELISVFREMKEVHECPLAGTRTNLVFGNGNADADLMFVGEAPGKNEDERALPFVGRAGKLLDQLLGEIGIERSEVFVTNVICCRPPGNRDPLPSEIDICRPYLFRKVELIEPSVVCTLGNFATKLLSGSQTGITRVHGQPQLRELGRRTVTLFPCFHPAAGLRSPAVIEDMRADFAKLPELLATTGEAERDAEPDPLL